MSDDLTACMDAGHFDPANILAMTPLVHLDVPCPRRVTSPERHPCGHASRTVGCGGCDPGAIEYVREDGGPWIRVAPPEDQPKLFVEQVSAHRWSVWVEWGLLRVSGEWGTYAWSRKAAIRKGQRLLAHVEKMKARQATREQVQ